jgi:hypothetical protein
MATVNFSEIHLIWQSNDNSNYSGLKAFAFSSKGQEIAPDREMPRQLILHLLEPAAILIAIILFYSLIAAMIRGFQIPLCFYCGAAKVRPSRRSSYLDLFAMMLLMRAYRCSGCQTRFRALRLFGARSPVAQRLPNS